VGSQHPQACGSLFQETELAGRTPHHTSIRTAYPLYMLATQHDPSESNSKTPPIQKLVLDGM
jgi:hypothetical protein